MARIAGVNIPQNKVVHIALTYIHGIGNHSSRLICKKLNNSGLLTEWPLKIKFKDDEKEDLDNAKKALQEAISEIETLKTKVTALEGG